jgi:hypothetical protein
VKESPSQPAAHQMETSASASAVRLSWVPLGASIAMLLMASFAVWPYGFYQLLRLVVTGTAVYVVVATTNQQGYWFWIMGGIAILFNPILPISFARNTWQPIDFGVAVVFLILLIQSRRRQP